MKLHYCEELKNFGDELNPWLWDRLLPDFFDDAEDTIFVGIGTLLNNKTPRQPRKIVFGTGAGYGPPPAIDERWSILAVRGPLTADALGVERRLAVTDPGVLVAPFVPAHGGRRGAAFVPHYLSARYADWGRLCASAGIRYIDPGSGVDQVLDAIGGSELVISESLHGAVVADALRVPWIPVRAYHHINEFKWQDWCESVCVPYRPVALTPLWDIGRYGNALTRTKLRLKARLRAMGIWNRRWSPVRPLVSPAWQFEQVTAHLHDLAWNAIAFLSEERVLNSAVARLQDMLDALRRRQGAIPPPRHRLGMAS